MSRPASSKSFRIFKLAKPNGRKSWKIEGRPAGKRERYYFVTEKEAKTAALDLNAQIAAGIAPWPQNGLRHSFCSYAVALKGFEWTAAQADHSVQMLRKHYWEVVDKETAKRYWDICR
jgi:hypothetical protein